MITGEFDTDTQCCNKKEFEVMDTDLDEDLDIWVTLKCKICGNIIIAGYEIIGFK